MITEPLNQEELLDLFRITQNALERNAALTSALQKIKDAIVEESKMPDYHKVVMKRHREEWGTLHNAIDNAIKVLEENQHD